MNIQKLHYENLVGMLIRREGLLNWRCPLCRAEGQSPEVMRACPECGSKEATLSGAQPAPSIPVEAIGKMLADVMAVAVSNGANSVSMPDEYVEVAVWLQGECPTQPAPSVPDLLESLRCACNYIDKLGGVSQQYRAMLAAAQEAKP